MLLSTDEVTEWLLSEFALEATEQNFALIDTVLNDTRLDDLYEPRDDAWGESEVPYAGPGDGSLMRGLTNFAGERDSSVYEANDKSAPFGSGMEQAKLEPDQKEIIGHT